MCMMIVGSLVHITRFTGTASPLNAPSGSGNRMNPYEVSEEIAKRLAAIFLRDGNDRHPVFCDAAKFQEDPHRRDHLLFIEYFHGDNGAPTSARSHRTGERGSSPARSTSSRPSSPSRCWRRMAISRVGYR